MKSVIRSARVYDALEMAQIDAAVSYSPWSAGQFSVACDGEGDSSEFALIVEQDNRIQGFVVCQVVLDDLNILNVAVAPRAQRRGIASALLERLLAAQPGGAGRCLLDVRESNVAARALYQKLGFSEDGVRRNYYPTSQGREDAVLMSLSLPNSTGDDYERA